MPQKQFNIEHDRREWGVARVVTRGPGAFRAFRGPERHAFFISSLFSDSLSKTVFPTVYRGACPPKSSVLPVNLTAWSKRKIAWPKKLSVPLALEGPFCSQTWGPVWPLTALSMNAPKLKGHTLLAS